MSPKRNLFTSVKLVKPNSSVQDLTHDVKLSCNMGELIPIFWEETVPGDRWKIGLESLLRMAPMLAPMMHRVDVYMHVFEVPYRLLWDNWVNHITGTKVAGNFVAPPYFDIAGTNFALNDYLGLPAANTGVSECIVNPYAQSAYQFIWNEFYRDQNLQTAVAYKLVDGDNSAAISVLSTLQKRAWEHDYFTAALPFAQKGDAADIPLGAFPDDVPVRVRTSDFASNPVFDPTNVATDLTIQRDTPAGGFSDQIFALTEGVTMDPVTIRDFRRTIKLQEFLERSAVAGTRYNEFIYGMFGVHTSDKSLQRPRYITGTKSPVTISEVVNTTGTEDAPQGEMAGHGVGVTSGNSAYHFCEEYGLIMGVMSVMPKTGYFQGVPKKFLRVNDRYEHYFQQFESIGEQEIQNQEVYIKHASPLATFGYVPRYSEYKYSPNRVSGEFRTTLKHWHMAREFSSDPALNSAFIASDPTMRVFAVTDANLDHLYVHVLNKLVARRLMNKYSTPHI